MKIVLKTDWWSPRCKLYLSGTVFVKNKMYADPRYHFEWYDFYSPDGSYGIVSFPKFFKK